jgi:hypothetical protein
MAAIAVLLLLAAPELSGTWKLDAGRSRVEREVGWPGLIGAGAPERIHVTLAANGTVLVESEINESHARIYRPGGKTSTPVAQTSTITMTSRWEGRALEAEGTLTPPSGPSTPVKEIIAVSDDGLTLTVRISATEAEGTKESSLLYVRAVGVEPCETWSTPCKPAGR